METHRRLAPCPAALEDGKLGPSTKMEEGIDNREGQDHNQERESCLVFVTFVCLHVWHSVILYMWDILLVG